MKTAYRKAFTLPELLIGMLLILIVLGGVVATLKSGLDVFFGSEANGKVTTGVRFTVASFKSEILPMVNGASSIEILKDMSTVPSTISGSGDYYIYRSTDNTVKCRSAVGDTSLNGSDYISSLDFSVPKASADQLENFILNMHIEGQDPKYLTAYVSIDVAMALVGKPEKAKSSNASGNNYTGGVLHFAAFDFSNLKVWSVSSDTASAKELSNNDAVSKGTGLQLRYDMTKPAGKIDATKMRWYASTKAVASMSRSDSVSGLNFDTNKSSYFWPLLIKSNDNKYYLANEYYKSIDLSPTNTLLEIPTSGDANNSGYLYVYTGSAIGTDFNSNGAYVGTVSNVSSSSSKVRQFEKYCFLRAWVQPGYSDSDKSNAVYPTGYQQWSDIIQILASVKPGNKFWNEWVSAFYAPDKDQYSNQHWKINNGNVNVTGSITDEGKYAVTMDIKNTGTVEQALIAKALRPDHLKDARRYDALTTPDGMSYTSITNYSIILDAAVSSYTGGLSITLNGYRLASSSNSPSGFRVAWDPGACGIKLALVDPSGGVGSTNVSRQDFWGAVEQDLPYPYRNKTSYSTRVQYRLEALKNQILDDGDFTDADASSVQSYMKQRRRFMITLVEYYTDADDYPHLLVRVKLLKDISDVVTSTNTEEVLRKNDPYLIGPNFYSSEPAWFGNFVGQGPVKKVYYGTPYYYFMPNYYQTSSSVTNNSFYRNNRQGVEYNGSDFVNKNFSYDTNQNYYAVKTKLDSYNFNGGYGSYGGVYLHSDLLPRSALESSSYKNNNGNISANQYPLGTTTSARTRWIGVSLWTNTWGGSNPAYVEINELALAPGFQRR